MKMTYILFLSTFMIGCAPTIRTTRVPGNAIGENMGGEDLPCCPEAQRVSKSYQVLGMLFVKKQGETIFNKPSPETMISLMNSIRRWGGRARGSLCGLSAFCRATRGFFRQHTPVDDL